MYKHLKNLKIYIHGEQPANTDILKLNANENPYPPTIKLIKNIIKELKFLGNKLKFYPNANSNKTKIFISKYYNLKINEIIIGNGSDEILAYIFLAFFKNKNALNITDLTYSFYESYIKLYKIKYNIIKLNKNLSININKYKNNKGNIIITNPNTPNGKLLNIFELELIIIKNISSIILIDEAYIDFQEIISIKLIKKYKNIIIVQTLSKLRSLAGVRIGLGLANNNLIENINKIKNSFNTYPADTLSQLITSNTFTDIINFEKIKKNLLKNKIFFINFLKKNKFFVINSKTNFLLIKHKKLNNNILIKKLKLKNIYIRKFEIPKINNFVRLTIGDKKNILKLIKKFKNLN